MATIHEFGTAPQVKVLGYGHLTDVTEGTREQVLAAFKNKDVCLVQSAHIHGTLATYEFGVFERSSPDLAPGKPPSPPGQ